MSGTNCCKVEDDFKMPVQCNMFRRLSDTASKTDSCCRLCGALRETVSIFGEECRTMDIYHKIKTCIPVQISIEDPFSNNICKKCTKKVQEFFEFIQRCLDIDICFRRFGAYVGWYSKCCRLCGSLEETIPIFGDVCRILEIHYKMKSCVPVEIYESDDFSKEVCWRCIQKIQVFYEFVQRCLDTDICLQSYGLHETNESSCRLCGELGGAINIFGSEGQVVGLLHKIQTCIPVQICEDDPYPNVICMECATKVVDLYDFVQQCIELDICLRSYGRRKLKQGYYSGDYKNVNNTDVEGKVNGRNCNNCDKFATSSNAECEPALKNYVCKEEPPVSDFAFDCRNTLECKNDFDLGSVISGEPEELVVHCEPGNLTESRDAQEFMEECDAAQERTPRSPSWSDERTDTACSDEDLESVGGKKCILQRECNILKSLLQDNRTDLESSLGQNCYNCTAAINKENSNQIST